MAKKIKSKPKPKGSKYDITQKLNTTFEDAMKIAVNTPIKDSKIYKK